MASIFEVFPRKIVAMVAVPFLTGLALLALLFDLDSTGWAIVFLVVFGGLAAIALLVVRMFLLEKEQEMALEDE